MMTRTHLASTIAGVVFLGVGAVSDGTLLDQTPQSFYEKVRDAVSEYVNPDAYYRKLGEQHDNPSSHSHSSSLGYSGLASTGSAQGSYARSQQSSQYTSGRYDGQLEPTPFDPRCNKKECDDEVGAIPDQAALDKLYREGLTEPTFKEVFEPQTYPETEEAPTQLVSLPPSFWSHYSQRVIRHVEVEYVYITPDCETPSTVPSPGTLSLSLFGIAGLVMLRKFNRGK